MKTRKMDNYWSVNEIVAEIVSDCALEGTSVGWCAYDYDLFLEVKERCAEFNVQYTCDFNGEFKHIVENNK